MTDTLMDRSPEKSEDKFMTFINKSLYGYVEFDLEGYVTFANKSAEKITGYRIEDNMNFKDVIIDEDLERAISDFGLVMTEPNAGPREYRLRSKDEVIIDVEVNTLPIKKQNEIIGFQSTVLDISDRKKIERELAQSEMRYRSILEAMEDEYVEFDLEGNLTFSNRSSLKKSGLTEDEFTGLNYKNTMNSEAAARVAKVFNAIYMTGQPAKVELEVYFKDKPKGALKKRYIENSAQLMKDEAGRKIGYRCVIRDITERKNYEKEIRETELKYTNHFESLREGILVTDQGGIITDANPAAAKTLGYAVNEIIGKPSEIIYADINNRTEVFENLNKTGYVKDYEMTLKKKDGSVINSSGSATLRRDIDGNVIGVQGMFSDITTEKKTEMELKKSEEKYEQLVQATNDLIFRVDRKGNLMFANYAFRKIFGYDQDELIGKSSFGFVHSEDLHLVEGKLAELLEGKSVENVEFRHRTKAGLYVMISINASPLYDSQRNIIGISGIGRDVTELKKVQDNLIESEAKYRSLVNGLMDGIVIAKGIKLLYVNKIVAEMFGFANEKELLGLPMTDLIAPEDKDMILKRGEARERGEIVPHRYTFQAIRKDGTEFEAEVSVGSIMYEGKMARQAILRDITQQKVIERELIKSEKKYRTIFENMKEGLVITNSEGKIKTVNPAALEIFGYNSPEEMVGQSAVDLYADVKHRETLFKELYEKGFVKEYEIPFIKSDGTVLDLLVSATLHRDHAGNSLRTEIIFIDITERKKLSQDLEKSEFEHRTLVESLNDLIFSVDLDGKFIFINKAFEKLFKYPMDVMKKINSFSYAHSDDLELIQNKFKDVIEGKFVDNVEFRYKRDPEGKSYVDLSVNASPLYDSQKKIIGITGIGRDITEIKKAKQELQQSKSISEAYMEATTDSAVLIDWDGTIVDANKEFGRRHSKDTEELMGTNVFDLYSDEISAQRKEQGKKVIKSKKPLQLIDERDGRWNDATIYPLFNRDGKVSHLAIFTHDITDLKVVEKKLKESRNELEKKVLQRTTELEEVNVALRVLVKNRDTNVEEMENRIVFNLNELIFPSMEKLKNTKLNNNQIDMIDIIKQNLVQITSKFSNGIESGDLKLTPAEMNIANLVKQGRTNREIAELYQLSARTVESHRDSIRKKIGIKNRKINLRSYLMSN